ncbi:unnamed protein product [Calicophoron daubneyi]|uniref:Methyltransferase-like protein 7A n=1 Tax=Calicophoron daubneyi TaxID=300641 RepID=A0AAV2T3F3_CALDB
MGLAEIWNQLDFEKVLPDFVKRHSHSLMKLTITCGVIYFSVPRIFRATHNLPELMSRRHLQDRLLKEEMFGYLQSYGKKHSEQECIRILEIGAGDGMNLDLFPYSSRLVVVDPSDKYRRNLENKIAIINMVDQVPPDKNGKRKPNLELESWLRISADDMVDDGSSQGKKHKAIERPVGQFDACVSTFSLCTVRNLETVLSDVASLVKPGGLVLTMEHSCPPGRLARFICFLWEPIMNWLTGHSHLFRRPDKSIKKLESKWEVLFSKEFLSPDRSSINPVALTISCVFRRR